MAENTAIEWADATFNPWIGCTRVGPGCDNCYAAVSTPSRSMSIKWGAGEPRHHTSASNWAQPLVWERKAQDFQAEHGRRQRVFCASLADVFDNEVPPSWRAELFALIASTPNLDWMLLTKRIGNVAKMIEAPGMQKCGLPANVWLGATVVNQQEAERDVPKLLAVPARVRFLSMEPLLGDVDLSQWLHEQGNSRARADRNRGTVGRRERSDLASYGRIDANLSNTGRHRSASEGQLPEVAVHLGRDALRDTRSQGGVVRGESISDTDRAGDQPQGRRSGEQSDEQSGSGQPIGKREAQLPSSGAEGEGTARLEEHQRETGRGEGAGDSITARLDSTAGAGRSVRRVTADHLGNPDPQDLEARPLIHWVICGGESGPGARPIHPDWARSLRDQCSAAGVPFLFKQWGEWVPYEESAQPPYFHSQNGREIDAHALPDFESEDGQMQREWHSDFADQILARRVGKKAAGRLLDGVEHNGFPTPNEHA